MSGHPLLDELIVVDDGSADRTAQIVREFSGVRLVRHEKNKGKTQAVLTGVAQARNDFVFLLDADLIGLTREAVSDLIAPVSEGRADMTISMRKNSPWIDRKIGVDIFSGERVFSKKLIADHVSEIARLARFGFESYLNRLALRAKLRIKIVFWKNVESPWKYQKMGLVRGVLGDVRMILNILSTISVFEVVYQFIKLRSGRQRKAL